MSTVWLNPYTVGDAYTCPACGQGVFTTMGPHFCPGYRAVSSPYIGITTSDPRWTWPTTPDAGRRPKRKVRD